jgi:beta-lactam-binding protein with PASTA domain
MAIRERPTGPAAPTELIAPPPPEAPEEPPPERELWPWLLVLVLLVLAGLAAAWYATRDRGGASSSARTRLTTVAAPAKPPVARVSVPDLKGMKVDAALKTLDDADLRGSVKRVDATAPKGEVTGQDPGPAKKVDRGSTVTLEVSNGASVVVPDLVGQGRDEAVHTLEAQRLKADTNSVPSDQEKDTVVSQHPADGSKVAEGSAVLLNISRGPAKEKKKEEEKSAAATVTVPDVSGESLGAAEAELRNAGLAASVQHVPSTEPKDTVVSQSPAGGTTAQRGAHVLLNVSKGEETKAKSKSQQQAASTVPSVIGEDEATARADLINAGFTPATVGQDTADPSQDGVVVDQTPAGGSSEPENSQVTIYIGRYNGG